MVFYLLSHLGSTWSPHPTENHLKGRKNTATREERRADTEGAITGQGLKGLEGGEGGKQKGLPTLSKDIGAEMPLETIQARTCPCIHVGGAGVRARVRWGGDAEERLRGKGEERKKKSEALRNLPLVVLILIRLRYENSGKLRNSLFGSIEVFSST